MLNRRNERKIDFGELNKGINPRTDGRKYLYNWFKNECPIRADKCDPVPYDAAIKMCEDADQTDVHKIVGDCKPAAEEAFSKYCIEAKNEIPSCYQFYPTTASIYSTTANDSNKMIPFIIGGVIGVIAILAIGIGIFCYCKKKKASTPGQSMTGTTTGGTTATGNTTKTGTKTNTGTTKAATTTGAPTARY